MEKEINKNRDSYDWVGLKKMAKMDCEESQPQQHTHRKTFETSAAKNAHTANIKLKGFPQYMEANITGRPQYI